MDDNDYNDQYSSLKNKTIFHKYYCVEKIGHGSFGCIYKATYNKKMYALKFESIKYGNNLLENEAIILNRLKGPNIPYIKTFGIIDDFNVIVMQLLGHSLDYYLRKYKKLSIKTVCLLGIQMISIIQHIHDNDIIHRDIKPDNFAMGLDNLNAYLYILDFGLSKKYRENRNSEPYPIFKKKRMTGTARYCSINGMKGYEHSRRDD